jgi:hypothetical protein
MECFGRLIGQVVGLAIKGVVLFVLSLTSIARTPPSNKTTLHNNSSSSPLNRTKTTPNHKQEFFDWIFANYIPSHHWYGTCRMGTDPSKGAVTDSSGRVYGTRKLRVADASIYPIKVRVGWVELGGLCVGSVLGLAYDGMEGAGRF